MQGFIGVFRTCADDRLGCTTNLCYVAYVPYEELTAAGIDDDHTDLRILSLSDIGLLPDEEKHWYPMFAFRKALDTMPPEVWSLGHRVFTRVLEKPELLDTLADRLENDEIVE